MFSLRSPLLHRLHVLAAFWLAYFSAAIPLETQVFFSVSILAAPQPEWQSGLWVHGTKAPLHPEGDILWDVLPKRGRIKARGRGGRARRGHHTSRTWSNRFTLVLALPAGKAPPPPLCRGGDARLRCRSRASLWAGRRRRDVATPTPRRRGKGDRQEQGLPRTSDCVATCQWWGGTKPSSFECR